MELNHITLYSGLQFTFQCTQWELVWHRASMSHCDWSVPRANCTQPTTKPNCDHCTCTHTARVRPYTRDFSRDMKAPSRLKHEAFMHMHACTHARTHTYTPQSFTKCGSHAQLIAERTPHQLLLLRTSRTQVATQMRG